MGRESFYWLVVLLTFIYIIVKNKNNSIKVLIILVFYSGLASFYGKSIENPYKIALTIISIYVLLGNNGFSNIKRKESILLFAFILFTFSFIYSSIFNGDYFTLVFSQYGKYFTPICLFFVFNQVILKKPDLFYNLKELFFSLLTIQIILSFVKIITIGLQESPVGSITFIGGGAATVLPVLGFILLWLHKQGEIKRKDWIYIFLLLVIGVVSYKRAIWFIMPVFILLFMYYIPRKVNFNKLIKFLPVVPIIFYAGIRLNPTLNKEGKIGGSFDLQFVLEYSQKYNFGKTSEYNEIQLGTGRGGATLLLFEKLLSGQSFSSNDYWGFGLQEVYTTNYEQFDEEKFGINSKGAMTGIFQSYIANGFIGVFVTVILIISMLGLIKNPRIRITIGILLFWDYFLYSGLILRSQALFVMLFYIILYANHQLTFLRPLAIQSVIKKNPKG